MPTDTFGRARESQSIGLGGDPLHISRIDLRASAGVMALLGVVTAVLLAVLAIASAPQAIAKDKNCSDFPNQKAAQHWFHKHHPHQDPSNLDSDNDGHACEDNPCPCTNKKWKAAATLTANRPQIVVTRLHAGKARV